MKKEEVKQCCAVCEYIYDIEKCPLYYVYRDSEILYNNTFMETGKYKMVCDEFQINSELVDKPKESNNNINIENIRETIKHFVELYVIDVKNEGDTPESLDFWVDEIIKKIH